MAYYIFLWNPRKDTSFSDEFTAFQDGSKSKSRWSCGNATGIVKGDKGILRRTGSGPKGIVGIGTVTDGSFQADALTAAGVGNFVRITWESLQLTPIVPIDDDKLVNIDRLWTAQAGGTHLSDQNGETVFARVRELLSERRATEPDFLPSAEDYARILNSSRTTSFQREILLAIFAAPERAARNVAVGELLGADLLRVNANLGLLGRKIIDDLAVAMPEGAIDSHALCWFERDADYFFHSHMHAPVIAAIEKLGWASEAQTKYAPFWRERGGLCQSYWEGRASEETRIRRARNGQAREQCIAHYMPRCFVCKFDFEKVYGPLGQDFIEVHHLEQQSARDGEYEIDPIADLRPVCSNCHRMLHRGGLKSIDTLKGMLLRRAH